MNDDNKNSISNDSAAPTENEARLNLLYEIGRILASFETMNEAAPQILEAICRHLRFELGELWCLGKGETLLHLESAWHLPASPLEKFVAASRDFKFAAGEGLPGKVWAKNAPVWVEDLSGEEKTSPRFFAENNLQSGFAFPILLGERFLGAFSFFSSNARRADETLLQMFAAVGNHIGQFVKREKIESSLRESEDRYRAFIEQSTEGIWRFELDEKFSVALPVEEQIELAFRRGYLAECNDAMARMYNFTEAKELIGSRIADLLDMSDAANVEYIRAFIESGYNLIDAESHEKDADGVDKYFLNSLVGTVENGYLVRVWGTQRDITGQKRAEEATRESEESYRIVAETASDAIIKIDEDSRILFVNSSFERIFGYRVEEMLGQSLTMIMPEDLRARHSAGFRRYQETGERRLAWEGLEIPALHADGHTFPLEISFGEYNEYGRRFFIGIARDITERKRSEEAVRESETNFRQLAEAVPQFVWVTETDGSLSYVNEQWLEFSGLTVEQTNDPQMSARVFHPNDVERLGKEWGRAFASGEALEIELRMRNRLGEYRWFLTRSRPVKDADGKISKWFGTSTDITDVKRAESRLALLAEISELTRTTEEPDELLFAVARAVGEHLQVRRCLFNEIDLERDRETVHRDYCRGVPSVAGVHRISDYSPVTSADMTAGKTVVNRDSKIDSRTAADYAKAYEPNGERAYISVPLLRENRWVASLWASDDQPRDWSAQEVSLLETIAERTWTAIEKLRIDNALRDSEERLQLAIDISRISTFDIDLRTDRVETDETGRRIYGFEMDEPLTFTKVQSRFHPEDRDEVARRVSAALAPEGSDEFEVEQRIVRTDGEVRWIRVRGRAFFAGEAAERQAVRCLGTYVDITTSKRAEADLRDSEEKFRNLANSISQFAWMADAEGSIFWYNERWFEYTGTTLDEMRGWGWRAVHHPDHVERVTEKFKRHVASGEPWEDTFPLRGANGKYCWFLSRALPIRDENDEIVRWFGTNTDITERKEIEAEREQLLASEQRAREAAEEANRAKDEFIALVSHELRSPLNAMLGWTRILQEQNPDEETRKNALDVIVRNARSQSRLIEDLLDIARVGKGKLRLEMQPTELIPIINAAIEIIKPAAEASNINFSQTLDRAANFITGDVDRLRQVIENLLSNAVKFTAPGGSVRVRLERENRVAKITISDTGQGISEEFLPQIFERFKQADPSTTRRHGGLGIGLSLARDLVELHGGTISAESAGEGAGSTFTVTLPLRIIGSIKEYSSKVEFMDAQGKLSGFWILAVDDEADARELVSFMLQINGAKVTTANSAVEALDILKNSNGRLPDVLLSDISMPNESGYALLEKIRSLPREHGGQIPAVALTAFSRPEDREAAFEAGFQKHLGKPVEPDDLISAIIETAGAK